MKTAIHPKPPQHKMGFVPGILVTSGRTLYISGCTALPLYHSHPHIPSELEIPSDIKEQTRRVLNNIKMIVESAGGKLSDVVSIRKYLTKIDEQDQVREVIWEYFGDNLPTSTTLQIQSLVVRDARLEIDAVAVIDDL